MQEVPSEHKGVNGGEDSVDPPSGDEQSLSLFDDTLIAHVHLVTEERLALIGRRHPGLVQREVCLGGSHQVEHFLPLKSDVYFGNTGVNINSTGASVQVITQASYFTGVNFQSMWHV